MYADALQLCGHIIVGHVIVLGARNPAPILIAVVAAFAGDPGNVPDIALDAVPAEGGTLLIALGDDVVRVR